jgi:DNA-binding NarL/FixJ family response regulator
MSKLPKLEEATVVSVEGRGSVLAVRILFDGEDEPEEYLASSGTAAQLVVGKRVPMTRLPKKRARAGRPPKITEVKVRRAIRKLGEGATQREVARELNVSASTIRELQTRIGKSWEVFISEAYNLEMEI